MLSASIFSILGAMFREAHIRVVLIGGYAINAHKVQRNTLDIDFMLTRNDYHAIETKLLGMGFSVFNSQDSFIQLKNAQPGVRDIDFMFCDEHTVDEIDRNGLSVQIAGEQFRIPSVLHLIALKLHAVKNNRERELYDIPDIVRLIRANRIDLRSPELEKICLKFGTRELYDTIISKSGGAH
jgi:hypothetical protein